MFEKNSWYHFTGFIRSSKYDYCSNGESVFREYLCRTIGEEYCIHLAKSILNLQENYP